MLKVHHAHEAAERGPAPTAPPPLIPNHVVWQGGVGGCCAYLYTTHCRAGGKARATTMANVVYRVPALSSTLTLS